MLNLPEEFTQRMKRMLGSEYEEFLKSYEEPRLRGLRVNTCRISPEAFAKIAPFPIERIPWTENGFFYSNDIFPARHPYYAAGLYYLQEPSAMTPASRLPVEPGERVLDLCAAPGGKATELAAKLKGEGILVANDPSNSRAKALLRNLELFGVKNMLVTSEMPSRLREVFPQYFDKILVDAPCSGEGMFRKSPEVAETWSPERVDYFAAQQRNILENAYAMLRPGGCLMYSTCTFSPDEDEQMMAWFLAAYPDMQLLSIEPYEGFSEGRPDYADGNPELQKCVRIWPHKMNGEGHFLALLQKREAEDIIRIPNSDRSADPETRNASATTADAQTYRSVAEMQVSARKEKKGKKNRKNRDSVQAAGNLTADQSRYFLEFAETPAALGISGQDFGRIEVHADKAYLSPMLPAAVHGINFLRNGVFLGEWKKKRFEPSQPLAMTMQGAKYSNCISLAADDVRVDRYLCGETIAVDETDSIQNGWILVCVDDFPIGWGKAAGATIKNKYPVSWRK